MSEYIEGNLSICDRDALVTALMAIGFAREEIEVHTEAQALCGFEGDTRELKAHVIIRRKYVGAYSNDIGFLRGADGRFSALISEYDRTAHGSHGPYGPAWLQRLAQEHGIVQAKKLAKQKALRVASQETLANGSIVLTLTR